MKPKRNLLLAASIIFAASPAAFAADVVKDNNANNLNLGTSWVGGTAPIATDVALFDSTYATVGTLNTGALVDWAGIRITSPGGNVTVNNSTAGQEIVLRGSGIDMSAATVDANLRRVKVSADQTWNVASGRTLNIGNAGGGARVGTLGLATGTTAATITKSGTGVVQLDTGNNSLGNISWNITGGTVRAIWDNANAWGSGTITLGGGGIATGTSFSGSVGDWTWNNAISLTSATSSFIDNQNVSGANRYLKFTGVISGSGNVEFRNTAAATMTNADRGFLIAGTNTNNKGCSEG